MPSPSYQLPLNQVVPAGTHQGKQAGILFRTLARASGHKSLFTFCINVCFMCGLPPFRLTLRLWIITTYKLVTCDFSSPANWFAFWFVFLPFVNNFLFTTVSGICVLFTPHTHTHRKRMTRPQ